MICCNSVSYFSFKYFITNLVVCLDDYQDDCCITNLFDNYCVAASNILHIVS